MDCRLKGHIFGGMFLHETLPVDVPFHTEITDQGTCEELQNDDPWVVEGVKLDHMRWMHLEINGEPVPPTKMIMTRGEYRKWQSLLRETKPAQIDGGVLIPPVEAVAITNGMQGSGKGIVKAMFVKKDGKDTWSLTAWKEKETGIRTDPIFGRKRKLNRFERIAKRTAQGE